MKNYRPLTISLLASVAAAAGAPPVAAQLPDAPPVHWQLTVRPAGGGAARDQGTVKVRLRLTARMDPGWYIYSLTQPPGGPTRSSIALRTGGRYAQDGDVRAPKPILHDDPNFGMVTETYHGTVAFMIPARTTADTGASAALVRYQTCDDRICLPPHTDTVPLTRVAQPPVVEAPSVAAPASAGPADGAGPAQTPEPRTRSTSVQRSAAARPATATGTVSSPAAFLWLAAMMGLLSLLTPCVFPMVPITIAFFTRGEAAAASAGVVARAETAAAGEVATESGAGRRAGSAGVRPVAIANAAAYALGIVGAFCGAGVLLTLAFGAGGVLRMSADPWLNLAITALFLAFALNLLGLYELRLPAGLMSRLGTPSGGHGPGAALLLGAAFAVTTFTCTAPFVGTLLVVATRGDWSWPLLGMLVFAGAFALPFFLLALLPDALARLPRSGEWMLTLRRALGVLEIAAAAKFLSNTDMVLGWGIFTRNVVIAIWAAAAVALALLILGRPGAVHRPGRAPALVRAAVIILAMSGAFWMTTGLTGARLGEMEAFLPASAASAERAGELAWAMNSFERSLRRARAERRPLLIDFTGYTCTNCRWMEANMFPRPEVRAWLGEFERVRLYTDGVGEPYNQQQALEQRLLGTVALPVYAILTPEGEVASSYVGMTRNSQHFTEFLSRGLRLARER